MEKNKLPTDVWEPALKSVTFKLNYSINASRTIVRI